VAEALGWPARAPTLTLETRGLAVQAATAGMGAAVVDRNLVTALLRDGLLAEIAPCPPVPAAEGHWFVALPDRLRLRPVRQFRDWLKQIAEERNVRERESASQT
jgi:DNA-binding transcriptional LysR family regulator